MASAVDNLKALVAPTEGSLREIDWTGLERRFGLRLPTDYKQLVEAYGQGAFDGFLWVLQPSEVNRNLDLIRQRDVRLTALRTLQASGEEVPFVVESGDEEVVPWAITDNGDVCYWVTSTSTDPDGWVVAVNEARGARWQTFDLSTSEFLLAVLAGNLRVEVFPDDFPSGSPMFEVATP